LQFRMRGLAAYRAAFGSDAVNIKRGGGDASI
jgi:hypothetical protein